MTRTASEVEATIGIAPLDELLAERADLVAKIAKLRALHGAGGVFDALRKAECSKIAVLIRTEAEQASKKITEAAIDQASHADQRYLSFLAAAVTEKADYFVLEEKVQAITDQIMRGQALARFASMELGLTPR